MNQKVYGCLSFLILFIATDCFAGGGDKKPKKTPTKFIDKSNMDESIKPGDNFYLYANANWLKSNPVPSIKTRWGSFDVLREESSQRLKKLLEEAAITPVKDRKTQMVGDMYSSAMDSVAIEAAGINPIKPQLDKIAALADRSSLLAEIATMRTMGLGSPLFRMSVDQDDKNVNQYIPQLSQGGTSLPDRDYYLKNDPRSKKIRDAYKVYLKKLFSLAGENTETAANSADAIMRIETSLAKVQYSRVEMRDPYKTYNKFSVKDFSATTPDMNWENLFSMMQVKGVDSILVDNPGFYKSADVMLSALSLNDWKCYLRWNVLKSSTSYLSSAFVDASFTFNQVISGQKVQTPRWQRTASLIDGSLGEMLGQLYVDKYFKPEAKERMKALVNNLAFAFEDRIKRLDWMSEVTKVKALEKLHSFTKKIGYPDQWKTYDGVTINSKDFLGNLQSTSKWSYQEMVGRMGKPVDRTRWGMTPPTINAYYNPSNNEIVFPAAILQFPFFDFEADDAINYGGIGGVIGHEMTHGFDDQGRQYAADGNLQDWWTKEDADNFKKRADQVVSQYNNYVVLDTLHVNGKLTLGENLADLGGLSMAYEAFTKTPQFKEGKLIDGLTPTQRFFLSWAQIWRNNALPETQAQLILTDSHSPGMHRANGAVVNMDEWYSAFGVKDGDKMYVPADKRIHVW